MKAIEINSKTDKYGNLKIDYPLNKKDTDVRVIILLNDEYSSPDDEKLLLQSISKNPAFDFLNDPGEDAYTCKSGEPIIRTNFKAMQTILIELKNNKAIEELHNLEEKKLIRIINEDFSSYAWPGKPLNEEEFRAWVEYAENTTSVSLNEAKQLWETRKKNLFVTHPGGPLK